MIQKFTVWGYIREIKEKHCYPSSLYGLRWGLLQIKTKKIA
jgi:hypothetical protein